MKRTTKKSKRSKSDLEVIREKQRKQEQAAVRKAAAAARKRRRAREKEAKKKPPGAAVERARKWIGEVISKARWKKLPPEECAAPRL